MNDQDALSGLKVLETGAAAAYAGKLFADHGAEVTMIEPADGSPLRRHGPFAGGQAGPSLHFHYLAGGKRSVVADLDTDRGRQLFKTLLAQTDLVLDDHLHDWWWARGLNVDFLPPAGKSLVWCSITPYGQYGPYAHFRSTDLTSMAMGGMAWLAGYADRPIVSRGEISLRSASLYAAVASLALLFGREHAGRRSFIDVSVHEVVALGTETGPQFFDLQQTVRRRNPEPQRQAGIGVYACLDGFVMLYAAEAGVGTGWTRLVEWMVESGVTGAEGMLSSEWATNDYKKTPEAKQAFAAAFGDFARTRHKQHLFIEGQRRRIAIAPVNGPADVLADPHLRETGYFRQLTVGASSVPCPGAPFKLSRTPSHPPARAPSVGEHG